MSWCGGLQGNAPHRLMHLNIWSPFGGNVWGCLEGVALLEEECHWAGVSEFKD